MNKKTLIIILTIIISITTFSEFNNLQLLEELVYGFNLAEIKPVNVRIESLEMKLLGDVGKGDIKVRSKKLIELLYNDVKEKSIISRVNNLEMRIYQKRFVQKSLLTRIELMEEKAYKRIDNENSIKSRVEALENYFEIKEERYNVY